MAFTCIVASVEHSRKQTPRKHSVSFPWPPHIGVHISAFSDKLRHKCIRLRCFYYAQCNRLRYRKFRWISNNSTSKLQNDRIVFGMSLIFCTHLLRERFPSQIWIFCHWNRRLQGLLFLSRKRQVEKCALGKCTTRWKFSRCDRDFFALGRNRDFCQLKRKSRWAVLMRKYIISWRCGIFITCIDDLCNVRR